MSDKNILIPVEQKLIDFYDDEITAFLVEIDNRQQIYIPIRPICDYLGLSWSGQRERINRDPILLEAKRFVRVTRTNSGGGSPNVFALPLDYLNGWLFGVNVSRVKEEIRENLMRYQRECYRVLADAFLAPALNVQPINSDDQSLMQLHNMALVIASTTKEMLEVRRLSLSNETRLNAASEYIRGMNNRLNVVEQRTRVGELTDEQAHEIQYRVNLIAEELTVHDPSIKHHPGVHSTLWHKTGSTSYKRIPMKGYESALSFLDNWLEAIQRAESSTKNKNEE